MPRRYKVKRPKGKVVKSKAWYSKKYSAWDMGKMALNGLWKLKGLVNSELYKYDTALGPTDIQLTGTLQVINDISVGDNDASRTGNSIYVRSLNAKGMLYRTTSGDPSHFVRLSVVCDTQQISDTTPSYTDIYESNSPFAHLNSQTVGRFKVLWTRTYHMDVTNSLSVPFEINLPMRHHIRFNGTAGTDVQKGSLYICYVGSQGTANFPKITGECRISYHDN